MALQKQLASIDITGGADTKRRDKLVLPGKLAELRNGVFDQGGTLSKRPGCSVLSDETTITGGVVTVGDMLKAYGDELVQGARESLYAFSSATSKLISRGRAPFVSLRKTQVMRNAATQSNCDHAYASNLVLTAWEDSRGGVRYSIQDTLSGAFIVADTQVSSTGKNPRVLAGGTYFAIFFLDGAVMNCARVAIATPAAALATSTIQTNVHGTQKVLDAYVSSVDIAYIAYQNTAPALARFAFDFGNLVVGAAVTVALANNVNAVAIARTADARFECFHSEATVGVRAIIDTVAGTVTANFAGVVTTDATPSAGDARQLTACESLTANTAIAYYLSATGAPLVAIRQCSVTSAGAGVAASELIRHCTIGGACFKHNNRLYLPLVFDSAVQGAWFLIDATTKTVVAGALRMSGSSNQAAFPRMGSPVYDGTSRLVPVLEKGRLTVQNSINTTPVGISRLKLKMAREDVMTPVVAGDLLVMPGAVVMAYDGIGATELGFHVYPDYVRATTGAAGNVNAGTRQICSVYEWTDAKGNRHQSAPSVPISHTLGVASIVTVDTQTLTLTEKSDIAGIVRANVDLVVYATEAGGTIFYRVGSVTNAPQSATGVATVTYNIADATLVGNEVLYSTGGILEHFSPPACRVATFHDDRLFLAGTEDDAVYFSKAAEKGRGLAFHPEMKLVVPDEGGEVTAAAGFGAKLIVFKSDSFFPFFGAGPNAAGQGATYTPAETSPADVGCTEPGGICLGPDGLWFKSRRGLRRLNFDLSVDQLAGAEMDAYANYVIVSAVLAKKKQQIRFMQAAGSALVFDYFWKQWSVWENHYAAAADVWQGDVVRIAAGLGNGLAILRDDDTVFADQVIGANLQYTLYFKTPPLKFAGVQGFQRLYRLLIEGVQYSAGTLTVDAAWNYGEDANTTELNAVALPANQLSHHLSRQKCRAVAFVVTMTAVNGRGFQFDNLSLQLGIKQGAFKRANT